MRKQLLFIMLLAIQANAQQEPEPSSALEEMVIQSNRLHIPISEQNRNITVITADEIQKLPAKTLNEVLSYVAGVDLRQRGPFGTQADISIDGGSFEQTLVLINGIRVTDAQTAHNTLNLPIPPEAIERIEILRGPAARIYGINSLTGAVNIVTRQPKNNGIFAHAFAGSNFKKDKEGNGELFNGRGIQLGGSYTAAKHAHQLYGSHESGSGYRYNTAYHNNKLFYQGEIVPNEFNKIDVLAGWANNSFGANGFYAAPGDKESQEVVNTTLVSVRSRHRLSDRFTLSPQIGYRYNYDDYRYFRHDLSKARSQHYSNSVTAEISGNYQVNFGEFGFGTEARYEQISSSNIGDHERENYGLYGEFRTRQIPRVDLTLGAYINYNSVFGWQLFPGIDVSYALQQDLKIVFNTGTSQRIPSFTDLYLDQRPGNIGNAALSPETAYQVEGGIKFNRNAWETKAIVFYRGIQDFIDWTRETTDVPWQANNVGKLKTTGLNASVVYTLEQETSRWKIGVSYTYLNPEMETNHEKSSKYRLENFKHQLVNTIGFTKNNWSLLLANRFNQRISSKDYFISDVRASYQHKQFNYYIDFQNIFNKTFIEAGAVPMPGRWFSAGIKFNTIL